MAMLLIEHPVPDWDLWKQVFDSDPVGRKRHGVIRYAVYRTVDDPNYVIYGLEFSSFSDAKAFRDHPALAEAQRRYRAESPRARIVEVVDSVTY